MQNTLSSVIAARDLPKDFLAGLIRYREDMLEGIDHAPGSIAGLYRGADSANALSASLLKTRSALRVLRELTGQPPKSSLTAGGTCASALTHASAGCMDWLH